MTTQIIDGTGTPKTVNDLGDFMATNPVGAQPFGNARTVAPPTTSDTSKLRIRSLNTVNNTLVSSTARVVRSIDVYNEATYTVYLKLFDKATAPVAGTDTSFWTIPIPSGSGFSRTFYWGLPVSNGFGYAITKNKVDTDTTAVANDDLIGMMTYR